jgi:deazaflavin-dependent oxidoreductase (nitroreductase family)
LNDKLADMADDWNTGIIKEFRANEGRVSGPFEGAPMILLHTTGAKSGKEYVSPLMYLADDADPNRVYIFASKGGAPTSPDWYHNLVANPTVTAEIGTETFSADAETVDREERDRIYAEQARRYPGFAEYEQKTTRVIPVVALTRK